MISAWPDIQNETIGELDEFMVIACDGIWYVPYGAHRQKS